MNKYFLKVLLVSISFLAIQPMEVSAASLTISQKLSEIKKAVGRKFSKAKNKIKNKLEKLTHHAPRNMVPQQVFNPIAVPSNPISTPLVLVTGTSKEPKTDNLPAIQQLAKLGKANPTTVELENAKKLIALGYSDFTDDQLGAIVKLNELKVALNTDNLKALQQLAKLGNATPTIVELENAKKLITLGCSDFTVDQLRAIGRINELKVDLTLENLKAAQQLITLRKETFSGLQLDVAKQLLTLKETFNDDELAVGVRLSQLGHHNFTTEQLTLGGHLRNLDIRGFTANQLKAITRLNELGKSLTKDNLNVAQQLLELVPNFTSLQFYAATQVVLVKKVPLTGVALKAAEQQITTTTLSPKVLSVQASSDQTNLEPTQLGHQNLTADPQGAVLLNPIAQNAEEIPSSDQTNLDAQLDGATKELNELDANLTIEKAIQQLVKIGKSSLPGPELEAAKQLVILKETFNYDELAVAVRLNELGHHAFTKDQVALGGQLRKLNCREFTNNQLSAITKLNELSKLGKNFTLDNLKAAQRLIELGHESFSILQFDAANRLVAVNKPIFTNDELAVGLRLKELNFHNFTKNQLEAGGQLGGVMGYRNFTTAQLELAEKLKNCVKFINKKNFELGQKLLAFEPNFGANEFNAAKQLDDLQKGKFTKDDLALAVRLKKCNEEINKKTLELGQKLLEMVPNFTAHEFNVAKQLAAFKANFTNDELALGLRLKKFNVELTNDHLTLAQQIIRTLGHSDFTADEFNAAKQLFALKANFTKDEVTFVLKLKELKKDVTLDHLRLAKQLVTFGYSNFTAHEFTVAKQLAAFEEYFTKDELILSLKLKELNQDVTSDHLRLAKQIVTFGYPNFTADEFSVAKQLVALKANFTKDDLTLVLKLKELLEDVTSDHLRLAKQIVKFGYPNFTAHEFNVAKQLAVLKENYTKDELTLALKLKELYENLTNDNLSFAQQLVTFGYPHFTANEFSIVKQLAALKASFTKDDLGLMLKLKEFNEALTNDNLILAQRLVTFGYPNFTANEFDATKQLAGFKENFTNDELALVLKLKEIDHLSFVANAFNTASRLVIILKNVPLADLTKADLILAQQLVTFGYPNFTANEFHAAKQLAGFKENFTKDELALAFRLKKFNKEVTNDHLRLAQQLVMFGRPNFTANEFDAVKQLLVLNPETFTEDQLNLAEYLVSWGQNNFTNKDLEDVRALRDAWSSMNLGAKYSTILDRMFSNEEYRKSHNLPDNSNDQCILKELALNKMENPQSIPNILPKKWGMIFPLAERFLKIASDILHYEKEYHLNRQAAEEFSKFVSEFSLVGQKFKLTLDQQFMLFKTLKEMVTIKPWEVVSKVTFSLLKQILPLDYEEWPNFAAFTKIVIFPIVESIHKEEDIESIITHNVENFLKNKDQQFKTRLKAKIGTLTSQAEAHYINELQQHGTKKSLSGRMTFKEITSDILNLFYDRTEQLQKNSALKEIINYGYFCYDPFLVLLREPDQKLITIMENLKSSNEEISALKALIDKYVPMEQRLFDDEFNKSFSSVGYGLNSTGEKNRKAIARLKRLYESIKKNKSEQEAALVLYGFGAENSERCIDGKRDRITELERQNVYIAGGKSNNDPDLIIGLNLSKLFMDHRMDELRSTINALFYNVDDGEPITYAWFRTHRALTLGFGLTGQYDEMICNVYPFEVDPLDFVTKYMEGGQIKRDGKIHNMGALSIDKMAELVCSDIGKALGGLFDDNTLDHMVHSNLPLRKAYGDFQEHMGEAAYENAYFKDGTKALRNAIKPEAIREVIHRYGFISKRDEKDQWR